VGQVIRQKIQALSLAKESHSMKLDLVTNATVVDDAIMFVYDRTNEKIKPSSNSNEDDKEESHGPDYDKDEDQLEEEKQEERIEEIILTTNYFLNYMLYRRQ
jgi:hypothetical protein